MEKTAFSVWLKNEITVHNISQAELARRAGISHGEISRLAAGNRMPRHETCRKIADGFQLSPDLVLQAAGYFADSPQLYDRDVMEIQVIFKDLPHETRRQIVQIARTFQIKK